MDRSHPGAGRQALLGSAMGLGFVAVSTLLIVAFGGYSFSWAHHAVGGTPASVLAVQAGAALTEELMFRGVALQAIEQRWGSRVAESTAWPLSLVGERTTAEPALGLGIGGCG